MKESIPPLLRGTGTLIVLLSTTVALAQAQHPTPRNAAANGSRATSTAGTELQASGAGDEESFVEDVVANRGFEWGGFCGTLLIAGSFFAEAIVRWRK